jgi:nucleotide-binding universal stress UspA family protein
MNQLGGSVENRVLIAIDLSENSLKAVDYVGRMLRCHDAAEITLLTVIKEPSADIIPDSAEREMKVEEARRETLDLMEKAGARLTASGIPESHIKLKIQVCQKPMSISDLVLREQQDGGYGTLVVGRRGVSKREEFLFGSVSSKVVRDAKRCAVWVIE